MKLVYQHMAIFFNFSPTSNHLHPLQVEKCDSNSRLVVDEDDNGKFRSERVKHYKPEFTIVIFIHYKPRIDFRLAVDEDDFNWVTNTTKLPCICEKHCMEILLRKTLALRKIDLFWGM